MKKQDIKRYLKDYSIHGNRRTTINNAFASALSIADTYDEDKINIALRILEQNPDWELLCAYCDNPAQTWDHITGIVIDWEFSWFWHQLSNLIPCCKNCNFSKGNKNWRDFLIKKRFDTPDRIIRIEKYIKQTIIDAKDYLSSPDLINELTEYAQIKNQVIELLKKGDKKADNIRAKIRQLSSNKN